MTHGPIPPAGLWRQVQFNATAGAVASCLCLLQDNNARGPCVCMDQCPCALGRHSRQWPCMGRPPLGKCYTDRRAQNLPSLLNRWDSSHGPPATRPATSQQWPPGDFATQLMLTTAVRAAPVAAAGPCRSPCSLNSPSWYPWLCTVWRCRDRPGGSRAEGGGTGRKGGQGA